MLPVADDVQKKCHIFMTLDWCQFKIKSLTDCALFCACLSANVSGYADNCTRRETPAARAGVALSPVWYTVDLHVRALLCDGLG